MAALMSNGLSASEQAAHMRWFYPNGKEESRSSPISQTLQQVESILRTLYLLPEIRIIF